MRLIGGAASVVCEATCSAKACAFSPGRPSADRRHAYTRADGRPRPPRRRARGPAVIRATGGARPLRTAPPGSGRLLGPARPGSRSRADLGRGAPGPPRAPLGASSRGTGPTGNTAGTRRTWATTGARSTSRSSGRRGRGPRPDRLHRDRAAMGHRCRGGPGRSTTWPRPDELGRFRRRSGTTVRARRRSHLAGVERAQRELSPQPPERRLGTGRGPPLPTMVEGVRGAKHGVDADNPVVAGALSPFGDDLERPPGRRAAAIHARRSFASPGAAPGSAAARALRRLGAPPVHDGGPTPSGGAPTTSRSESCRG